MFRAPTSLCPLSVSALVRAESLNLIANAVPVSIICYPVDYKLFIPYPPKGSSAESGKNSPIMAAPCRACRLERLTAQEPLRNSGCGARMGLADPAQGAGGTPIADTMQAKRIYFMDLKAAIAARGYYGYYECLAEKKLCPRSRLSASK
ncbi:MAG: hypothetical protein H6Q07_2789 [Acidobacteria bacterium]|nr:hypothetical protein [Acidobacteriota bacterium]